ncbi:uncharacterized protein LOC114757449 [Neltuma alba]|uniref:uncharacterized protein LOC114757449 n=1 Tax=Neltuma alba TaxID=207710 RepID=UPI0010A2D61B|nr:uncharacterized protein LOC114757449 [Prosopis alba]
MSRPVELRRRRSAIESLSVICDESRSCISVSLILRLQLLNPRSKQFCCEKTKCDNDGLLCRIFDLSSSRSKLLGGGNTLSTGLNEVGMNEADKDGSNDQGATYGDILTPAEKRFLQQTEN